MSLGAQNHPGKNRDMAPILQMKQLRPAGLDDIHSLSLVLTILSGSSVNSLLSHLLLYGGSFSIGTQSCILPLKRVAKKGADKETSHLSILRYTFFLNINISLTVLKSIMPYTQQNMLCLIQALCLLNFTYQDFVIREIIPSKSQVTEPGFKLRSV